MFNFKKKFGQNFLVNEDIVDIITNCFSSFSEVFEIGPGNGVITRSLLKKGHKVTGVEIDKDCIHMLKDLEVQILNEDILKYSIPDNLAVVGNLPYNISSKVVEKIVRKTVPFAVLMFQKEVADILVGRKYSRLTVFAQSRYKISKLIDVKPGNFVPVPKVNSQVLIFERIYENDQIEIENLSKILFTFFKNRRKKIKSIKKNNYILFEQLQNLNLNLSLRPEQISKDEYFRIAKDIKIS